MGILVIAFLQCTMVGRQLIQLQQQEKYMKVSRRNGGKIINKKISKKYIIK